MFLLFSGNFAYFFNLIVSASEHLIPKLSDTRFKGTGSLYSRTLSNQRFDFELCVANGAFCYSSFQLAFHWIQVSPQFHIVFMLSKSACYWRFFSKFGHCMQATASSLFSFIFHSNRSHEIQLTQYLVPFLKSPRSWMQYLLLSCICSVCKQYILHLVSTA